jgi:dienelactone hydrolase
MMPEILRYSRQEHPVRISAGNVTLDGDLTLPEGTKAIVLFAHGSGSSRFSTRNRYVAHELNRAGLGTLLFDLLTRDEEREDAMTREFRFDIGLLADRLSGATDWVIENPETRDLNIGYFGASTGAAAALVAAAQHTGQVDAIVSRGGRPDLAGPALANVKAPTLLIVGGDDYEVIQLNEQAYRKLHGENEFLIIEGATHLFEEPGKLEDVATAAAAWFVKHLTKTPKHHEPTIR